MKRRQFIRRTGAAGAGVVMAPHFIPLVNRVGANDTVVVAVAGIHSRGAQLSEEFASLPGCEIRYLIDVDSRYFDTVSEKVVQLQGTVPKTMTDYRRALDDSDIDALIIATPDHWHAPMAIESVKAGKHVYVEKPCSHNPREGELLVEAFRKYGKLVQMGNQRRSMPVSQQLVREIAEGIIGNVYFARTWYTNSREPIGFGKTVPVPDYLDFELWQGPAPRVPYRDNIHPYNWHWFWHWGTGEALNNGTHEIDVARWAMGLTYPIRVSSQGGRFHYVGEDDWECPDTQMITYEFLNKKMITWEGRSCNAYDLTGEGRGVIFYGTKGSIVFLSNRYKVYDNKHELIKEVKEEVPANTDPLNTRDPGLGAAHTANFVESIRGKEKLNAPVDEGQKSILLCQLGNISLRTGQTLYINQDTGYVMDNMDAERLWRRDYEPGWEPRI
jgi:predicted dehydrogenase